MSSSINNNIYIEKSKKTSLYEFLSRHEYKYNVIFGIENQRFNEDGDYSL